MLHNVYKELRGVVKVSLVFISFRKVHFWVVLRSARPLKQIPTGLLVRSAPHWSGLHIFVFLAFVRGIHTHTQYIKHAHNHILQYCHVSIYTYQCRLWASAAFLKVKISLIYLFFFFLYFQHHQERHSLLTDESVRGWTFNPPPLMNMLN